MQKVIGKVAFRPRGAWNTSNTYEKLDAVTNDNKLYIALKDVPANKQITDTEYWWECLDGGKSSYELPIATTTTLGGVKPDGNTITVDSDGTIHGSSSYTLPTASTTVKGGVKVDGTTITADSDGTLHGANTYTLPVATTTTLGGIKADGTTITVDNDGTIHGAENGKLDYDELENDVENVMLDGSSVSVTVGGNVSDVQTEIEKIGTDTLTTTAQTLTGAVNELNSPVSHNTLLFTNATTTYTNYALSDNLNNYKYIVIGCYVTDTAMYLNPIMVPVSLFKGGIIMRSSYTAGQNMTSVKYVNDTTVTVQQIGSYPTRIFGIK